ncbi:Thioredoxin reductase [Cucumispora dikerogammari]|nr:Thioredoxin reductase [Cucumispora dikerogammari]
MSETKTNFFMSEVNNTQETKRGETKPQETKPQETKIEETKKIEKIENLIIIGSGPAGYAAALKAKHLNPILFEGAVIFNIPPGGQLTTTTHVDNYPGFPNGIQGPDLMKLIKKQAINSNIRTYQRTVTWIEKGENDLLNVTVGKRIIKTRSIIIASGSRARRLYVKGTKDNELWQKGISSCAVCDSEGLVNKIVGVIGGGDTAMEEAHFLSNIAKKVYLIHRNEKFRARNDFLLKIQGIKNIYFMTNKELKEAKGNKRIESIVVVDTLTAEESNLKVDGLFFAIGHDPNTFFFDVNVIKLNQFNKYIMCNNKMETSLKGVFAAGDVVDFIHRQAITASGSGVTAALSVIEYLKDFN